MNNALPVTVTDSLDYLHENFPGRALVHLAFFFDQIEQFPSGQVLHDNDQLHVGEGVAVRYFDDVGVGEGF